MRALIKLPSPAMVVALIALAAALGGSAYAVKVKLKPNQVKTQNIADDAVTGQKANEATFGTVPDAAKAASAANAAHAGAADSSADASALGGFGPGAFVRGFGARVDDQTPSDVFFSVSELKITILNHAGAATAAAYRLRNDSNIVGDQVIVNSAVTDKDGSHLFTVNPSTTSGDHAEQGPFYVTSKANPDLVLVLDCTIGAGNPGNYCWGALFRTPAS
jgi:hypothetical protein